LARQFWLFGSTGKMALEERHDPVEGETERLGAIA